MKTTNFVFLGDCRRPFGIKGGFIVRLENEAHLDSSLSYLKEVCLFPLSDDSSLDSQGEKYEIDEIYFRGKKVHLFLKNITNRNDAERILPFKITSIRSSLRPTSPGEYYLHDLEGLAVYEEGIDVQVGTVHLAYDFPGGTNLTIRSSNESGEDMGDEWDIPFNDVFVKEVDLEKRKIIIVRPVFIEE